MFNFEINADYLTVFIAVCSLLVSCCAVYIAREQGIGQKDHNKLSVRPTIVDWLDQDDSSLEITYQIKNIGMCPAIFCDFSFAYESKEINADELKRVLTTFPVRDPIKITISDPGLTGLPSNTSITLIKVKFGDCDQIPTHIEQKRFLEKIKLLREMLEIRITYKSVYDEEQFSFKTPKH